MNSGFRIDTPQHMRQMLDHVPSMLAYWDRHLRCRFANRAYRHWLGVDPDMLVGTWLPDLLGPQLFELNEPLIRAVLDGQEQIFERIVPGPDGARRHSLAHYVPDVVDGEVAGFISSVTDVTRLKATEATLRAEVAQREIAFEQLRESKLALVEAQRLGGVGSWEWDIAPDITVWSDELYRIFGRDPDFAPPTFAEHPDLYSAESWERLQSAVAVALRAGEPYSLELEYVQADGRTGWLEARGEAVRGPVGEITRLRGTVYEVSLRHAMEDARVSARSAESASHNKTQLLSRVSHELRTPLNAILGLSGLMRRDAALDAKQKRWASIIDSSSRHMLEMVEEVLDLARAEAGQILVRCIDIDPVPIVEACLLQAGATATAADVVLREFAASPSDVRVRGDAKRLKQVLDNLLSNAIKYTPAGGSVQVTLSHVGSRVDIAVRDTGAGLTAVQIDRVFEPFERLGAETSGIPGTGLGLALSRMLMELMQGSIRVESEPGLGSTFTVSLQSGSRGERE